MVFTAVSWNLFHGRDFPPDPKLFTWRSRLLGVAERNETHVQVNRDLKQEFGRLLGDAKWDVALLQECPPRFAAALAAACKAEGHRVLTSRNSMGALRGALAHVNPDLLASAEGGSNLTLVRSSFRCALCAPDRQKAHRNGGIVERREVTIRARAPERRAMALTRIALGAGRGELCVANLHATNDRPERATEDALLAARAATEWAAATPLLFGGDLNLRPATDPQAFERLDTEFGLTGVTGPRAIDHLLVRGLATVEPPRQWSAERRELRRDGLALRLSDHAPVEGKFESG